MKLQNAMETLMTYSWAILIIAVVLASLYALGLFNPYTFQSKAQPGACYVYRPYGTNTTSYIELQGVCNNELPEFTAQFSGTQSQVSIPDSQALDPASATVTAWFELQSSTNQYIVSKQGSVEDEYDLFYSSANGFGAYIGGATRGKYAVANALSLNTWYFGAATYNSTTNTIALYINGVKIGASSTTASGNIVSSSSALNIGYSSYFNSYLTGGVANVQVYNSSLSPGDINTLYYEGIGGAPVSLTHIIGWWPLNANANDYSGDANNGTATSVKYISTWYYTYGTP